MKSHPFNHQNPSHGNPGSKSAAETGTTERELQELFFREEFNIEKRINLVIICFTSFFLLFSLLLPFITGSDYSNPNVVSDIVGASALLIYSLITRYLIHLEIYHAVQKYITVFFTVSIVTIVVSGYIYGVDYVHATRTVTLTAYFLTIIAAGLYQHPILPLFAAGVACLEYSVLFFSAILSGFPVSWKMESFRENILTYDIWVVNVIFFLASGILVHSTAKRHRELIRELRKSTNPS